MLPPGTWHPAFWQTYRFITDPLKYSRGVIARYGKTVRMRALNGKGIATTNPEMVKLVFAADPDILDTPHIIGVLFGQSSVVATSGATHRRQRKLLNPRFHGPRMKALLSTMARVADDTLSSLDRAHASGSIVVMIDLAQELTLNIILETVFGDTPRLDRPKGRRILVALVQTLSPILFASPLLRSRRFAVWRRFADARAEFDGWVDGLIAQRRVEPSPGADILNNLLDARYDDGAPMENAEIRDQLFTLLIAGHETTSVAIGWGVYHLIREHAVLARLRDELGSIDRLNFEVLLKQPYLAAVCQEALRIEPAVTDIARVCKKPLALGPYTVPAGELVFINSCAMLRDEELYPEPHRFRPDRFLERKYGPAEFTPFGGGQRRCLGAAFAEAELAIVLATIAHHWDLELTSTTPETSVRKNIMMGPKRGVRIRVVGRRRT